LLDVHIQLTFVFEHFVVTSEIFNQNRPGEGLFGAICGHVGTTGAYEGWESHSIFLVYGGALGRYYRKKGCCFDEPLLVELGAIMGLPRHIMD
jgi:hypothetical protein